jgi:phosphohistidine phosphatase
MGLELHLLRHAKSSWAEAGKSDRERELNSRGRRDAPRMGRALATELEAQPVHLSPARRAQATLAGLCEGWPELAAIEHTTVDALYTFSGQDLVQWIRQCPAVTSLFLIGHNPGFTELVNFVCGRPALDNLPTAGYVHLCLAIEDWAAFEAGCGELSSSQFPRDLAP